MSKLGEQQYGCTDLPNEMFIAGINLEPGDKRLLTLLVTALGAKHPAVEDLVSLIFRARRKEATNGN